MKVVNFIHWCWTRTFVIQIQKAVSLLFFIVTWTVMWICPQKVIFQCIKQASLKLMHFRGVGSGKMISSIIRAVAGDFGELYFTALSDERKALPPIYYVTLWCSWLREYLPKNLPILLKSAWNLMQHNNTKE